MIPATISAVFFLIAATLGSFVLAAGVLMKALKPKNKWRYVVYVASAALFSLAAAFYVQMG